MQGYDIHLGHHNQGTIGIHLSPHQDHSQVDQNHVSKFLLHQLGCLHLCRLPNSQSHVYGILANHLFHRYLYPLGCNLHQKLHHSHYLNHPDVHTHRD